MRPAPSSDGWTQAKGDALMGVVVLAWGIAYVFMKLGLSDLGVFELITLRFLIAFGVLVIVLRRRIRGITARLIGYAAVLGFVLFIALVALMSGLKITTASSGAFFCSATIVIVPIIEAMLTRKPPSAAIVIGTILAAVGIALLSGGNVFQVDTGAGFCLLGAFLFAVHIIFIDRFTRCCDALLLGIFQLGFAGAFGLVFCLIFELPTMPGSVVAWVAVLGLALICSAFAFVGQVVAQAHTTPYHTAIIMSLEPVFAAIFSFILLHESFTRMDFAGAALILAGVLVAGGILNGLRKARTP